VQAFWQFAAISPIAVFLLPLRKHRSRLYTPALTLFVEKHTRSGKIEKTARICGFSLSRRRRGDFGGQQAVGPRAGPPRRTARDLGRADCSDPGDGTRNVFNRPRARTERNLPGNGANRHSQPVPGGRTRTDRRTAGNGGDRTLTPSSKKISDRDPIRLTADELRALPELHRLVAQIYLNRRSGEVVLVEQQLNRLI